LFISVPPGVIDDVVGDDYDYSTTIVTQQRGAN